MADPIECPICHDEFEDDQALFRHITPRHRDDVIVYGLGHNWIGGEIEYETPDGRTGVMTVMWAIAKTVDGDQVVLQLNINPATTETFAERFTTAVQQQTDWRAARTPPPDTWRDRWARLRARWGW